MTPPPPQPPAAPAEERAGGAVEAGTARPQAADGVELLGALSGSGHRRVPGLVRRGDGQTLQLTPLLYRLLDLADGTRELPDLARDLTAATGTRVEPEDVAFLLEDKLRPLGVLRAEDGSTPVVAKANPLLALRCKLVITDPSLTRRITSPFARLFSPLVALPAVLAFLLVSWWVLFEKGLASATHQAFYEPGLLLTVFALTVVSAGFHEFGHAAACRYGGATPGAMGAGLYLVWPAFYTDVDDSYRLGRGGRLRVDLGGLYFNALFAVGTAVAAWATGAEALLLVVMTQLVQMLRQLAPFMRADGYHILADLTGVPDLFAHIRPTLTGLLPRNWGRPESRVLKPWARYVVTVWVLVVVPVLIGMLALAVWLLPRLAATAWHSAGLHWAELTADLSAADPVAAGARLLSLVALVLPVLAITYLVARVTRSTARSVWRSTEGRPKGRAAAVLAAAALVALVAWAWWPNGQYDPVRGDERGTIPSILLPGVEEQEGRVQAEPVSLRLPGVAARPAMALVPRTAPGEEPRPTVLLLGDDSGGMRTVLTSGRTGEPAQPGRSFPFVPPPAPAEGDNQAVALGEQDGGVVYDVSYALVWVTDGADVDHRNEAWALASCTDCTTVAVAFQVLLVVGQSDEYVPQNRAVAANHSCRDCLTQAVAVQLVATLEALPDEQTMQRLAEVWQQLDVLEDAVEELTVGQIYGALLGVRAAVLEVLDSAEAPVESSTSVDGAGATAPPPATEPAAPLPGDAAPALDPAAAEPTADPTTAGETTTSTTEPGDGSASEPVAETTTEPTTTASEPSAAPTAEPSSEPPPEPTAGPMTDETSTAETTP